MSILPHEPAIQQPPAAAGNDKASGPEKKSKREQKLDQRQAVAAKIAKKLNLKVSLGEQFFRYDRGRYVTTNTERMIVDMVQKEMFGAERRDVAEVLYWLKHNSSFQVADDKWDTDDMINCGNGVLDWRTGALEPHRPWRLDLTQIPALWDPTAYHARTDEFLGEFMADAETRSALEEWMGYCLLRDCRFQRAAMLAGLGSNGKSVFLSLLEALLGGENIANVSLHDLAENRFRTAGLVGKVANIYPDLPREALSGTDLFKALVAGDVITVERKFGEPFSYRNHAKLVFSANEIPHSRDRSDGYFRRWLVFPCIATVPATRRDPELLGKLTTPEALSYSLRLAVDGLGRLVGRGRFCESAEMRQALGEYRRQCDSTLAFIEDRCEVVADAEILKADLFSDYLSWAQAEGLKALEGRAFFAQLKRHVDYTERRPEKLRHRWHTQPPPGAGSTTRLLVGIRLRGRA